MTFLILFGAVAFLNLIILLTMRSEISRRAPSLFNTPAKRIAWLLSCFIAVPIIVFLFQLPGFFYGEIKKFVSGKSDEKTI